jgi:metal-sulfur cluster biosynthetic enzyme
MATTLDDVTEAMKDVIDPELGINVVDLGLIYDISIDNSNQDLVSDVKINWVWMPPWGPDKITDDGREQLRAIGFTV